MYISYVKISVEIWTRLAFVRDRSFFKGYGGLVGFGGMPCSNCMTPPPLSLPIFSHDPPSKGIFLGLTPPPLPPPKKVAPGILNFNTYEYIYLDLF